MTTSGGTAPAQLRLLGTTVVRRYRDGERLFDEQIALIADSGLTRHARTIASGGIVAQTSALLILNLTSRPQEVMLCLLIAVPGYVLAGVTLAKNPTSYAVSLVTSTYNAIAILISLLLATSSAAAIILLLWMLIVSCNVYLAHGRIAAAVQSLAFVTALGMTAWRGSTDSGVLPLSVQIVGLFTLLAAVVNLGGIMISAKENLRRHIQHSARLARLDDLTGLLNRRGLAEDCALWEGPIAVAVVDVDAFKSINDALGHSGGDEVLRHTARHLQSITGPRARIARLGGDEFVVVCGTFPDDLADHLSYQVGTLTVRASVGTARGTVEPGAPPPLDSLIAEADAEMYRGKRAAARLVRHRRIA